MLVLPAAILAAGVRFDGGSLSEENLDAASRIRSYKLESELYRLKKKSFEDAAFEKLAQQEASKTGVSAEEFLRKYSADHAARVEEKEVMEFYNRHKDELQGDEKTLRGQIEIFLTRRKEQESLDTLKQDLFRRYHVRFDLVKPRRPDIRLETDGEPSSGKTDASVTVVEFSDFQCPYCRKMQDAARRLRKEYGSRVNWVFKDFPLPFHRQAMPAHIAANCAHRQSRFFEYQEALFDGDDLSSDQLLALASKTGLDKTKFSSCIADKDGALRREIDDDMEYGKEIGVEGTPALFINGIPYEGFRDYPELKVIIEEELKR